MTTKPLDTVILGADGDALDFITNVLEATQFYDRTLIGSNIDALMTTDPHVVIPEVNRQMEARHGC